MRLIATKRPASEKLDRLAYVRSDGSACETDMPRQGVLPHDLVHYVVESGLGLGGGFLSLVARGADARFVMELTHGPEGKAVEQPAVQAEALVEAMQTQLWSGTLDYAAYAYAIRTAAEARGVTPPEIPSEQKTNELFQAAIELNRQWNQVQPYKTLELVFAETAG